MVCDGTKCIFWVIIRARALYVETSYPQFALGWSRNILFLFLLHTFTDLINVLFLVLPRSKNVNKYLRPFWTKACFPTGRPSVYLKCSHGMWVDWFICYSNFPSYHFRSYDNSNGLDRVVCFQFHNDRKFIIYYFLFVENKVILRYSLYLLGYWLIICKKESGWECLYLSRRYTQFLYCK